MKFNSVKILFKHSAKYLLKKIKNLFCKLFHYPENFYDTNLFIAFYIS